MATIDAQGVDLTPTMPGNGDDDSDQDESSDELGLLDRMVEAERSMPQWTETMTALGSEIEQVGKLTSTCVDRINSAATGSTPLQARLRAVKKYASQLQPHGERVFQLGREFAEQLASVDVGITATIEQCAVEFPDADTETKQAICEYFDNVRRLVVASQEGFGGIEAMAESVAGAEGMSKDVRPPMRKLRQGLLMALDGAATIEAWGSLMDSTSGSSLRNVYG